MGNHRIARQAKQLEQDHMDDGSEDQGPDMENVVTVPTKRQKDPIKGLAGLKDIRFDGFDSVPGNESLQDSDKPVDPVTDEDNSNAEASEENVGTGVDPATQEVINEMEQATTTPEIPDSPLIAGLDKLRDLKTASDNARTTRLDQLETLGEFLAFLDEEISPDLKKAREENDSDRVAELEGIMKQVLAKNPRVQIELDNRKKQLQAEEDTAMSEAERQKQAEAGKEFDEAFKVFQERANSSFHKAIAKAKETGEPQIVPPVILGRGVSVPGPLGQDNQFDMKTGMVPLVFKATVLGQVHWVKKPNGGMGLNIEVLDQYGSLCFDQHPGWFNGTLGLYPLPSNEEGEVFSPSQKYMAEDRAYALKMAFAGLYRSEEIVVRRQEVAEQLELEKAEATLTILNLVREGEEGTCYVSTKFLNVNQAMRGEVVLSHSEKTGFSQILVWGPANSAEKWDSRFPLLRGKDIAIQEDKDHPVELQLDRDGNPSLYDNGLARGNGKVDCRMSADTLPEDGERRAAVIMECKELGRLIRQAMLNALHERHMATDETSVNEVPTEEAVTEEMAVEPEASETVSAEAEVPSEEAVDEEATSETDKPHRHHWRVDCTCRCGKQKPPAS